MIKESDMTSVLASKLTLANHPEQPASKDAQIFLPAVRKKSQFFVKKKESLNAIIKIIHIYKLNLLSSICSLPKILNKRMAAWY